MGGKRAVDEFHTESTHKNFFNLELCNEIDWFEVDLARNEESV